MTASLALWLLPAVLVFWAVGAYNRLVRLRSKALQAYAALDAELQRQAELLQTALPLHVGAGESADGAFLAWRGLQSALSQFSAVLSATRRHALKAGAVAALATARDVLVRAWQRVLEEGQDLAGAPVPAPLSARWEDLARAEAAATLRFNEAVASYNAAIHQFPAVLLAQLFGMRAAGELQT